MTVQAVEPKLDEERQTPAWSAVYSMGLTVAGLITAEMLPVSQLTSIAADLHISEGMAGQTVTATAALAVVVSLFVATATRRIDRRYVLLALSVLLVASNLLVAIAPGLPTLIFGRLLLGLAMGGFWALSTAMAIRLVPRADMPKALAVIAAAASLALVVAPPLGSYFGGLIGWRSTFWAAAVLGLVALLWQLAVLPSIPPTGQTRLSTLLHVLKRREVWPGIVSALLNFTAQFAFFTYLRPFLESVTHLDLYGISGVLLGIGVASFIGTSLSGRLISRSLTGTILMAPVLMGVAMAGLLLVGGLPWAAVAFTMLWGITNGTVSVSWSTWLACTVPDETETGGGLMVATYQSAVMFGAAAGGFAVDHAGPSSALGLSVVLFIVAAVGSFLALRTPRPSTKPQTGLQGG